jgi:hypothetical protein
MIWPVDSPILSCQSGAPNNPERCPKKDTFLVKAPLFERLSNFALFQTVKRKISPDLWREHDKLLESLKGKSCCRQVKFYSGVSPLTSRWSCLSRILARRLNPAVLHPARSNCRIRLAGLRRRLASCRSSGEWLQIDPPMQKSGTSSPLALALTRISKLK